MIIGDFAPVPSMTVHNADIAKLFNRLADLLEIEEANPFRVRAFRRVAETIEALPQDVAQLVAAGEDVSELPGIGEDLAVELKVIVDMGRLKLPPTGSAHQSRLRMLAGCLVANPDCAGSGVGRDESSDILGRRAASQWDMSTGKVIA
jgi:DNA polymerase/3'-5' exonuclease PolX